MLLSKSCIYGLRAAVQLASRKGDGYTPIRELSDELNISFYFLTKVLQKLTKSQILHSYKGPNGGVKLARSPAAVTFMDVVISVDGNRHLSECVLGLPGCGVKKPCPLHEQWSQLKVEILNAMQTTTLEKMVNDDEIVNSLSTFTQEGFFDPK